MAKLYNAYKLDCDECGIKFAQMSIDGPNPQQHTKGTFDRQRHEVTEVVHKGHNWHYVSTLIGGTDKDLSKWMEEHDG